MNLGIREFRNWGIVGWAEPTLPRTDVYQHTLAIGGCDAREGDVELSHRKFPESFAVVIPVYNHADTVAGVIYKTMLMGLPVFVVDDGSTDRTPEVLRQIPGMRVLTHRVNRGKGAAIWTGLKEAENIARWAVTIDADGQHFPEDAGTLIGTIPEDQRPIVVGVRQGLLQANAPWTSRFGRSFSNFWVWVSGGPWMADSQSGFRIYPIAESLALDVRARRYQFEIEILVKARRRGIPIIEVPIRVHYGRGSRRVSHYHPFFDFLRNFGTFARLITERVFSRRLLKRAP
jgi:glycosyltransferase involved in cell wall biosynthesis